MSAPRLSKCGAANGTHRRCRWSPIGSPAGSCRRRLPTTASCGRPETVAAVDEVVNVMRPLRGSAGSRRAVRRHRRAMAGAVADDHAVRAGASRRGCLSSAAGALQLLARLRVAGQWNRLTRKPRRGLCATSQRARTARAGAGGGGPAFARRTASGRRCRRAAGGRSHRDRQRSQRRVGSSTRPKRGERR